MKTIYLKTVQPYFDEVWSGNKTWELRKDDRDIQKDDAVVLQEYIPEKHKVTDRRIIGIVGFVLREFPGLEPGYCIFTFHEMNRMEGPPIKIMINEGLVHTEISS